MDIEYNSGVSVVLQLATVAGALVLALHGSSMLPTQTEQGGAAPTAGCQRTVSQAQADRRDDAIPAPTSLAGQYDAQVGVGGETAAISDSDAVEEPDDASASGKIQYDSGLPTRHRSLSKMFATLASPEQPGSIRAQLVRDAGIPGRWVAAERAHYILHADSGGGEPKIAAYADREQADDCGRASGGRLLSYQQVLSQSHYSPTSN